MTTLESCVSLSSYLLWGQDLRYPRQVSDSLQECRWPWTPGPPVCWDHWVSCHTLLSPNLLWETKQKQSSWQNKSADEVSGVQNSSLSQVLLMSLLKLWNSNLRGVGHVNACLPCVWTQVNTSAQVGCVTLEPMKHFNQIRGHRSSALPP